MDWGQAFKVGGPATVAAFVFYSLISSYIEKSGLLETSLGLNILLLVVVFVFCVFLAWLLFSRKNKNSKVAENELRNNEIEGNVAGSDINIGKKAKIISGNNIKGNKSDGDINIG
jgi:D-alanyl-lipoteichoic acid acyltransferase DltB (MBOAT superfamily)